MDIKQNIETESKRIENKILILENNTHREMINERFRKIFDYNTPQFSYIRDN